MPTVSGKDLISQTTEKVIRRTVVISSIAILCKAYDVQLNDLKVIGVELPNNLIDMVLLALVVYHLYSLTINWVGDLAAFRLWFRESSIWSQTNTNMPLDKSFIQGGTSLLMRLYQLEKGQAWPTDYSSMSDDVKKRYDEFKNNIELYIARLDAAGTKFHTLTWFSRYYVWLQSFVFPVLLGIIAIYLLIEYGSFELPRRL